MDRALLLRLTLAAELTDNALGWYGKASPAFREIVQEFDQLVADDERTLAYLAGDNVPLLDELVERCARDARERYRLGDGQAVFAVSGIKRMVHGRSPVSKLVRPNESSTDA